MMGPQQLVANGPAIKGVCVTRRKHRFPSVDFSQEAVTVQACLPAGREGMARFLASWCKAAGLYVCRGTRLIESRLVVTLLLFY